MGQLCQKRLQTPVVPGMKRQTMSHVVYRKRDSDSLRAPSVPCCGLVNVCSSVCQDLKSIPNCIYQKKAVTIVVGNLQE